ncbi:MAG: ribonuclease J [Armatimonadetes bacterium]|nr:ribonuclease J [Armatimonadota bacterium]
MSLLKVIPLGGAGEIGKNCTVVEMGDDLIVIDCGLSFPHEEHFGVDIVVPNFDYLRDNKDRLKAVVITHAHEDHVGALSFFVSEFDCPIYCTPFTEAMVRAKLEERVKLLEVPLKRMTIGKKFDIGAFEIEPIRLTHSIPEMCAIAVHTSHGVVMFTGDFKFDFSPVDHQPSDIKRLTQLGEDGVLVLLSDSTNVDRPGWGPSESAVAEGYRREFSKAKGRIMVTMFSSNIHRMQQVFDVAKEVGRRVAVAGRRMDDTVRMCQRLGYLNIPENVYLPLEELNKRAAHEVIILVTGSQGEPMAALSQMSRKEYSRLQIVEGDTILYSARPIPGNEGMIWRTVNRLIRLGASVVTDAPTPIHVSGHGYQDELKMMVQLTKPFYLAPVHGEPRHQLLYLDMAKSMGHPEHRMFHLHNGSQLCFDDQKAWIDDKPVKWGEVLIDQHGNVPVTDAVLGQRAALAMDGVIVVSLAADLKAGALEGRPEAQIKGFSGPGETIEDALDALCDELAKLKPAELKSRDFLEGVIVDIVKRVVQRKCQQRPVVIPVVVAV